MTKETFVEEVSKLPGVGKKAAEALYDAGFTSVEKLKKASEADLTAVAGIGPKTAKAILTGLAESEAPAAKQEVKIVEAKAKPGEVEAKAAAKTEIVEGKAYQVKIKADLPEEVKAALAERARRKSHEPYFRKYHWYKYAKLSMAWRRARGELNKQRRGFKYRPARVKIGWGKPAIARGLHPSGFEEVLVQNVAGLDTIDPKTQAARIGGTVGMKKRKAIVARASELKVRVLNPGVQ